MLGSLVQKHSWLVVIIAALLAGTLYVLPQVLIWKNLNDLGKQYQVIQLTHHSDEAYGTWARYREIYDGHLIPGDLYFEEEKSTPFGPFQALPLLMAGFLFISNGSTNIAYILAHFFFPIILFLLFYALGIVLVKDKLWALFLGFLGVFTPVFSHAPFLFKSSDNFLNILGKNFIPKVNTPLADLFLARSEDPLLTYLILIPAIIFLVIFWRRPNIKITLAGSFFTALIFYSYFHYWVYFSVVLGFLFLVLILFRIAKSSFLHEYLKYFVVYVSSVFVLTIPYWVNIIKFNGLDASDEISGRIGIVIGRYFHFLNPFPIIFDYIFYLFLGIIVYFVFFRFKKDAKTAVIYWTFIASMFVVWNIQVVVGYTVHPDHWFRAISPFLFVILFHIAYVCAEFAIKNKRIVSIVLFVAISLLTTKKIINASIFINLPPQVVKDYSFNDSIANSWAWINKNLPSEFTIVSDSFVTGLYLNSRTSARPFLAGGFNSYVSNEQLEDRFLKTYKAFGVDRVKLAEMMKGDINYFCPKSDCPDLNDFHKKSSLIDPSAYLYVNFYKYFPGREIYEGGYRYVTKEKAEDLIKKYNAIEIQWTDLSRGSYIYYGPWENIIQANNLKNDRSLDLVFKNQEVELYSSK